MDPEEIRDQLDEWEEDLDFRLSYHFEEMMRNKEELSQEILGEF